MTVIVILAVAVISFIAGRKYERSRFKYIVKTIKTQEVLGVFKK